jgi:membrane protein implicated in regulation of membrane protease activity
MVSAATNPDSSSSRVGPGSKHGLKTVSPKLHSVLSQIRSRVRKTVFLEGLAAALVAVMLLFWLAFALDYAPVLFGFRELPWQARAAMLAVAAIILLAILYRLILRRIFVSLKNSSLALLVERKYPELGETLITTVEVSDAKRTDVPVDQKFLEITQQRAESLSDNIQVDEIVNSSTMKRFFVFAGILASTLFGFAVINPTGMGIAAERIYFLNDTPWPRTVNLEIVGIKVKRETPIQGIDEHGLTLAPIDGQFKVAKGSTLTLMVRAQSTGSQTTGQKATDSSGYKQGDKQGDKQPPKICTIQYRTADGSRGSQILNRVGNVRDGWQLYTLTGSPLQGILSDLTFDLRGEDHRIGPFEIKVVDEPVVVQSDLECVFPQYLVDEQSMSWTPRSVRWTGQASLPKGTTYKIAANANKKLQKVYALDFAKQTMSEAIVTDSGFEFSVAPIEATQNWHFYMVDEDRVVSERPYVVAVEPIDDQPPNVIAKLKGIGTAVTPDAMIQLKGKVEDDYGLQQTWIELETPTTDTLTFEQKIGSEGKLNAEVDFLAERRVNGLKLPADEGAELSVTVKSADFCTLNGDEPNIGVGDKFILEIVSPNKLLRILERLEVDQRRRLEQIFEEVSDVRGYLQRTKADDSPVDKATVEPGDSEPATQLAIGDDEEKLRRQAMRVLFAQRSTLQIAKSSQETLGVAEAFESIRLQLENNRIDSADRKERLEIRIVAPLREVVDKPMKQLSTTIKKLESTLSQIDAGLGDETTEVQALAQTQQAMDETDTVLSGIDEVLSVLVKYETQNELLDLVRQLIEEQKAIMEQTKKKRQRDAFEGLFDE